MLDNLPHDRVWRARGSTEWQQTLVETPSGGRGSGGGTRAAEPREVLEPVSDTYIARALSALQRVDAARRPEGGGLIRALSALLQGEPAVTSRQRRADQSPLCVSAERVDGKPQLPHKTHLHHDIGVLLSISFTHTHIAPPPLPPPGGEAAFLPTGALRLFDTLSTCRPRCRLLALDVDALPEVAVPGRGAPLVATTVRVRRRWK